MSKGTTVGADLYLCNTARGKLDHATADQERTLCGREIYVATGDPFRPSSAWSCKQCQRAATRRPMSGNNEEGTT